MFEGFADCESRAYINAIRAALPVPQGLRSILPGETITAFFDLFSPSPSVTGLQRGSD
jgi:hypothetical protein